MKLTTLTAIASLIAAPVFAEDYPTQISEPVTKTCCSNSGLEPERDTADVPWAAVGAIGLIILMATLSSRKQQPDLNATRPQVHPEMCMEKVAGVDVMVACDETE